MLILNGGDWLNVLKTDASDWLNANDDTLATELPRSMLVEPNSKGIGLDLFDF